MVELLKRIAANRNLSNFYHRCNDRTASGSTFKRFAPRLGSHQRPDIGDRKRCQNIGSDITSQDVSEIAIGSKI